MASILIKDSAKEECSSTTEQKLQSVSLFSTPAKEHDGKVMQETKRGQVDETQDREEDNSKSSDGQEETILTPAFST